MKGERIKKVKLKGNESFNFREGWLRKGMRCVDQNSSLFSSEDVMEQLGVGSKMVKSIRFWLQATKLCEEKYTNSGRSRAQYLTEDFGRVIFTHDPYFDDIFTLFLLHYKIVSNEDLCIAWNIFFNEYNGQDFLKEEMIKTCMEGLEKKMEEGCSFSESSFSDDCSSILRMYVDDSRGRKRQDNQAIHPEDSLACPLADLGLLRKSGKKKDAYIKVCPSRSILDKLAVLYVIVDNMKTNNRNAVSIDDLVDAPNNIGRVFNLDRVTINEYLDQLRISGYLTINRTAGLDMVYLDYEGEPDTIMQDYYLKAQVK